MKMFFEKSVQQGFLNNFTNLETFCQRFNRCRVIQSE